MIVLFCFYATIGEAKDVKKQVEGALNYLADLIGQKYQLSTTGYQGSMYKGNRKLTRRRANEYHNKAKEMYPNQTLKELGKLQKNYINRHPKTGELLSPHHFKGNQLSGALHRCREKNFANCEMQALEAAIHIYVLGFKDMAIISNKAISHNYLYLEPTNLWPRGAIIDPWSGYGLRELSISLITRYRHVKKNIMVPQNMMDWIKKNAKTYANKKWIREIRRKFFPGEGPKPLKSKLIPIGGKN